ncbi:coniferyl aldehyde dehydrogenase [Amphiplicatus metriothermophilus]|uniref:Aldehyde dehydrogenase n=1 Tax=Amphiplicatus metriothermophilus TaxID=1519374 RepID=A0A239PX20_9PROT|nr:coniferyl aldehyde dehydrogenase [Amphiplicatus metriothermophilus]MBB5519902.1 coniferyl-aldehyde dehydrogenase [Amphiplicatus metriothermophilus]SNT74805.1 coniferyl-aldehyde dehydrogenase [Amphiplicatus metriothermophilus]
MGADSARAAEDRGDVAARLRAVFALQKQAFAEEPYPSQATRAAWLDALERAVETNEERIVEAISADFDGRARAETLIGEVLTTLGAIRHARRRLARWMRPRRVATPLHMLPGRSRIVPQPLGVVGIIAPWNYPLQLALSPAAAALAAGDRVMIKPSEITPRTSALMKEILGREFDERVLAVAVGGVETGAAFAEIPFDHLLFTGSTAVGRRIAEAAAKNLTPTTLELGGKSPAIIDESADLAAAARAIAHGKLFNAGQTCVAPDYVLAPRGRLDATVEAVAEAARALYPEIDTTPDYTAVVSDRHFARLKEMVEEARAAGARIVEVGSANALHPRRKLPFTIVVEPPETIRLMKEEIFGPVLPVLAVENADDAIARVNAGERPLALYWFGRDAETRDKALKRTVAGGVTVNGTLWHVAQENLPFGGVGASGQGAYHGEAGFETFSHMKPVFQASRLSSGGMLHPPYTDKTARIINFVKKVI